MPMMNSVANSGMPPAGMFPMFPPPITAAMMPPPSPMVPQVPLSQPAAAAPAATSTNPYSATPEELAKYSKIYDSLDQSHKGFITADQMTEVLKKTRLPETVLGQAWELAETDTNGNFDKANVMLLLHLLVKHKSGIQLPQIVPADLKASIQAFLKSQAVAAAPVSSVGSIMSPQHTKVMPQMVPPKNVNPDDPFAEIEQPGQAFGGVMPLYGYPQLPAPVYPSQPEESKMAVTYPVPSEPFMPPAAPAGSFSMSPAREPASLEKSGAENTQIRELVYELQNLTNERQQIKNSLRHYKTELTREENVYASQVNALRELTLEFSQLAKGGASIRHEISPGKDGMAPYQSSDKAATAKTNDTGFGWGPANNGTAPAGNEFFAGGGNAKVDDQGFDFS